MAKKIGVADSLLKSLALHGAIVAAVVISVYVSPPSLHTVEVNQSESEVDVIEAVAIDSQQVTQQVERIQEERAQAKRLEEERVAALERRAREAQQRREREQQESRRAQEERNKQQAEARAEAERLEQVRQEAEKRIQEQKEEEAKIEEQRRQRIEEERRREEAARKQAELERQIREEAESQRAAREKERQSKVQSEVDRFKALIQQTIQQNWLTDPSMRGQSCALRISTARDGFVTNVQMGDGDRAVCESARAAVLRAGSLPVSDDPDVYRELSNFTLRVEPNL